jgi:hypothetical protein
MLFEGAAPRRWIAHPRSATVEVTSTPCSLRRSPRPRTLEQQIAQLQPQASKATGHHHPQKEQRYLPVFSALSAPCSLRPGAICAVFSAISAAASAVSKTTASVSLPLVGTRMALIMEN